MLEAVFLLVMLQALILLLNTMFHHELALGLPWSPSAFQELKLYAIRHALYCIIVLAVAWTQWHGIYVIAFMGLVLADVLLALRIMLALAVQRVPSGTERIVNSLILFNDGLILAMLLPKVSAWWYLPRDIIFTSYGAYSWLLSVFAFAFAFWAVRNQLALLRFSRQLDTVPIEDMNLVQPNQCILITGGSGFIGRHLAQQLIEQGHRVIIYTRSIPNAAIHFSGKVCLLDDLDTINAQEKIDVLINLAGASIAGGRWNTDYKQQILQSRVNTTKDLYHLCERLEQKPKLLLNASAVGYYGHQGDHICDETQDGDDSFSHQLCYTWEQEADQFTQLGIRVCLLRLGVVLGLNGGPLAKLLFPFELFLGGRLGDGSQWFSWVHLTDVLRSIVYCINKESLNGAYNVTAPDPVRNRVLTEVIGKALRRPTLITLPDKVIKKLLGQLGEELFLFSIRATSDKIQLEGFEFKYPRIETALANLLGTKSN